MGDRSQTLESELIETLPKSDLTHQMPGWGRRGDARKGEQRALGRKWDNPSFHFAGARSQQLLFVHLTGDGHPPLRPVAEPAADALLERAEHALVGDHGDSQFLRK